MKRKSRAFNPIDVHVGQRIRMRRLLLSISQEKLSVALDVTFQQIQKRERGANRVSASALFETAKALGVPVSYFFEGLPGVNQENAIYDDAMIDLWSLYSKLDAIAASHMMAFLRRLVASPAQRQQAAE